MYLTILIAVISAAVLVFAGYLLGAGRGLIAREDLRAQLLKSSEAARSNTSADEYLKPLDRMFSEVSSISVPMPTDQKAVQAAKQQKAKLTDLMEEIAKASGFKTVLLGDEKGLPIAASHNHIDRARLVAIAAYTILFGERIRDNDAYLPAVLLFQDVHQHQVLSRIFMVGERRVILTAMVEDATLSLDALDVAIPKITQMLQVETISN